MKVWFHTTIKQDEPWYDSITNSKLFATEELATKDAELESRKESENNLNYYNNSVRRSEIRERASEILKQADLDISEVIWKCSDEASPLRPPHPRYIYFLDVVE